MLSEVAIEDMKQFEVYVNAAKKALAENKDKPKQSEDK